MTSAQLSSEKLSIAFSVGHSAQLSSTKLTLAQLSPAQLIPAQLSYAHSLAKLCSPRLSSVHPSPSQLTQASSDQPSSAQLTQAPLSSVSPA